MTQPHAADPLDARADRPRPAAAPRAADRARTGARTSHPAVQLAIALAAALAAWPSGAQAGATPIAPEALRQFVERAVGPGTRVEVKLGELDPRLQLAPCGRIEPFLPPGARLWGRSFIALRCTEGASWSVSLPVTVGVWGRSLVANQSLTFGATPSAGDFRLEEIELTRENGPLVADAGLLDGRIMARPIAAGQALRADHLKVPAAVTAGDPVKIRLVGDGFSIASDGTAISTAGEGQPVRVRLESGRIVSGTVRERQVEIRL